jgi:hypothetical protein
MMWQKCQILVPSPIWQPGSKMALGWAKKRGFSINLSKASPSKGRKGFSEEWWKNVDNQAIEKIIVPVEARFIASLCSRSRDESRLYNTGHSKVARNRASTPPRLVFQTTLPALPGHL